MHATERRSRGGGRLHRFPTARTTSTPAAPPGVPPIVSALFVAERDHRISLQRAPEWEPCCQCGDGGRSDRRGEERDSYGEAPSSMAARMRPAARVAARPMTRPAPVMSARRRMMSVTMLRRRAPSARRMRDLLAALEHRVGEHAVDAHGGDRRARRARRSEITIVLVRSTREGVDERCSSSSGTRPADRDRSATTASRTVGARAPSDRRRRARRRAREVRSSCANGRYIIGRCGSGGGSLRHVADDADNARANRAAFGVPKSSRLPTASPSAKTRRARRWSTSATFGALCRRRR